MNNLKIKFNNDLSNRVMQKLMKTKDLLAILNILMIKMKNPYLLTYILEKLDTISSNEVENIHTTVDEAANDFLENNISSPYTRYREALKSAHRRFINTDIISSNDIVLINNCIRAKKIGFRKTPAKIIRKPSNKIVHYGVDAQNIPKLVADLTKWINTKNHNLDPVIKSLLIHHQFEYIHPFTDGNGRAGRILFAILLTKYKVLEVPASVFSYSIVNDKNRYYESLQAADKGDYENYLNIMLDIFNDSLVISINFAQKFNANYSKVEMVINNSPNSKILKLLPHCFTGVKVSVTYLVKKSGLNNKTITKYLRFLENLNIMKQEIKGKYRPYKNLVIEKLIGEYLEI